MDATPRSIIYKGWTLTILHAPPQYVVNIAKIHGESNQKEHHAVKAASEAEAIFLAKGLVDNIAR